MKKVKEVKLPIRCKASEYALAQMKVDAVSDEEKEAHQFLRCQLNSHYENDYIKIIESMNAELVEMGYELEDIKISLEIQKSWVDMLDEFIQQNER